MKSIVPLIKLAIGRGEGEKNTLLGNVITTLFISLNSIIMINKRKFEKTKLITDTQLAFKYFLNNLILTAELWECMIRPTKIL